MVNVKPVKLGNRERMSFGKINEVIDMPNLIDVQKQSYQWFLDEGLKEVFKDVSGITDYQNNLVLDFIDYSIDVDHPNYSIVECKSRDATFSAALRVTARLLNRATGEIKESNVFMGDFPLMTPSGTFIINGAERVIVSQLVRSPGVYYKMDHDKTGKELYSATVIPNRGAWLEYETDINDVFYVRIDKNRKLPVTAFIRSLGLGTDAEILDFFGDDERMRATIEKDQTSSVEEGLIEVYRKLRPSEPPTVDSAQTHINNLFFDPGRYDMSRVGRYKYNKKLGIADRLEDQVIAEPISNPRTGEVMAFRDEKITKEKAVEIENAGVQIAYVKAQDEKIRNLPAKELVMVGVPYMDAMVNRLAAAPPLENKERTVLLAPSWGKSSILNKFGDEIIKTLLETGYHIIIRPHPQSFTSETDLMNHLMAEFPNSNSLEWNRDSDNFDVLRRSDILISDFSGIVYDYSLVYRKPVIYADVEFDDSPYDAWWLDTPFWPIASLPKIGKQLTKDNMQNLKELIDSCIESTEYKNNIDSLIEETWQYKGEGAVRTADYIVNKYNELTEKNKANL